MRLVAAEPKLAAAARLRPLGFGAASFTRLSQAKDGGRDRDRTCDPYHVKEGVGVYFEFLIFTFLT